MITNLAGKFLFASLVLFYAAAAFAQTPTPTPDEPIRVFTEEVQLNVTAQTTNGRFVSTLKKDDLLIVEEGTPQKIESMKKVPASVLFLLDTGGNLNFAKSLDMTRLTAKLLVEKLSDDNSIGVLQSYNKVETVSEWTGDRAAIQSDLDRKLFGGNRSRFSDSIRAAVKMFETRPLENRHLVFIGDGLDSVATASEREKALGELLAANVTVHVIAYNKMEAARAKGATRGFQIGEEREAPRLPSNVLDQIVEGMPREMRDNFRRMMKSERLFVLRLDRGAIRVAKQKRDEWIKREADLSALSEDTGGMFQAPEELETMWVFAVEIAKAIESQYVVTYVPTKPFAGAETGESRKVRVSTHCDGVVIRSRQKLVLVPKAAARQQ